MHAFFKDPTNISKNLKANVINPSTVLLLTAPAFLYLCGANVTKPDRSVAFFALCELVSITPAI